MSVFTSDAPEAVVEYVQAAIGMPDYRRDALDLAERRLGIDRAKMDRALVRARWTARWARAERSKTLSIVEDAVNEILRRDHLGRLVVDRRFAELPQDLRHPDVREGVLTVKDARTAVGAVHIRAFLECTPPEIVVRTAYVAAEHRRRLNLRTAYPFPLAWDVTSGSRTVPRVLGGLGGQVVASDLTPHFNDIKLDARDLGLATQHRLPFVRRARTAGEMMARPGLDEAELSVDHPHIIYFDPPSRGWPTHQELYGDGAPSDQDLGRDLAELDRDTWVTVVGGVAVLALLHLGVGGVVSLLVREGRRERERVFPEEGVADEVLGFIRERIPDVVVLDDLRVVYDPVHTCNQRSLGASRLPMRHVVLAKGATS